MAPNPVLSLPAHQALGPQSMETPVTLFAERSSASGGIGAAVTTSDLPTGFSKKNFTFKLNCYKITIMVFDRLSGPHTTI